MDNAVEGIVGEFIETGNRISPVFTKQVALHKLD